MIAFDGVNKKMLLSSGTTEISTVDLWSRWVDWTLTSDNGKYLPAMRNVGGDAISTVKNLGMTFFMINGWRVVPASENHRLALNGNLFTAPAGDSPIDTVPGFSIVVEYSVSSLVDSTVAQLPEIQHGVYENRICIDAVLGTASTTYPLGTLQYPVNNLADAKTIAAERGFNRLYIKGNLTIGATESISGYVLLGQGPENTVVTLTSGCVTSRTDFMDMSVTGSQSGETHYHNCDIGALDNVHCQFVDCRLIGPMTMSQVAADTSVLANCYTGDIAGATFVVDLNNSPCHMSFNNFHGKMQFINMNKATAGVVTVNMGAGKILVDSTCTTGTIKVRGSGEVISSSGGTVVDNDTTARLVWESSIEGLYTAEEVIRLMSAVLAGKVSGAETTTVRIRDLNDVKDRIIATVDTNGNRSAVTKDVS
jgi:hypothetical protein